MCVPNGGAVGEWGADGTCLVQRSRRPCSAAADVQSRVPVRWSGAANRAAGGHGRDTVAAEAAPVVRIECAAAETADPARPTRAVVRRLMSVDRVRPFFESPGVQWTHLRMAWLCG